MSRAGRGAADLLRAVGLMADGPVPWGRPVGGRGPGVYVVELPSPPAGAPIDMGKVAAWLAHRPEIRIEGARPTSKELAARLAAFWVPGEPVVFATSTTLSIGGRVTALYKHVPGDRKPHAEGQWLHVLFGLAAARVWWAGTTAPDEALDAFLTAFAEGVDPAARAALPDQAVVLPFATTRRPTGERKAHGIIGAIAAAEKVAPLPPTRLTDLPPGDAEGTEALTAGLGTTQRLVAPPEGRAPRRRADDGSAPERTASPLTPAPRKTATRAPRASKAAAPASHLTSQAPEPRSTTVRRSGKETRFIPPTVVTADGLVRLQAEHEELTKVMRPVVILRIRTAKEHGDLKENSEYHAARAEQSFLEGRIQSIEAILRNHVIAEAPEGTSVVHLGSTVTIQDDYGTVQYSIVGPTEASPGQGRISTSSPVGSALLGRGVGDDVLVRTPRGDARYKIVSIE